jgi:hypothetical protein
MPARLRHATLLALALALAASTVGAADAPPWQHAGRLGLVQYLVVPVALASDRKLYERAVIEICPERGTCFLRFFTNSTGAAITLPLPDAIAHEPTVIFQRSDKRAAEDFRWSCRLKLPGNCF